MYLIMKSGEGKGKEKRSGAGFGFGGEGGWGYGFGVMMLESRAAGEGRGNYRALGERWELMCGGKSGGKYERRKSVGMFEFGVKMEFVAFGWLGLEKGRFISSLMVFGFGTSDLTRIDAGYEVHTCSYRKTLAAAVMDS